MVGSSVWAERPRNLPSEVTVEVGSTYVVQLKGFGDHTLSVGDSVSVQFSLTTNDPTFAFPRLVSSDSRVC